MVLNGIMSLSIFRI